jgi:hypothetical protein
MPRSYPLPLRKWRPLTPLAGFDHGHCERGDASDLLRAVSIAVLAVLVRAGSVAKDTERARAALPPHRRRLRLRRSQASRLETVPRRAFSHPLQEKGRPALNRAPRRFAVTLG